MSVYNGADHLAETLESIAAQTERDFELIVVDDGSTDDTASILDRWAANDARVRVLHEQNRGLTRSLVKGCAEASGTYIARHDAGDLSLPHRFEKQVALLDAGAAFVSCWTEYVGPRLEPLWVARGTGATDREARNVLQRDGSPPLLDGPTHHGSVMFRRETYQRAGGYRPAFYYGQDFDLWYRLAALGTFHCVPDVLYRARVTPGSISSTARPEQQQYAALSLEALRARSEGRSDEAMLERAAAIGPSTARGDPAEGLYFIGEALRRNGDARCRAYFRAALARSPLRPAAWLRLAQSFILRS